MKDILTDLKSLIEFADKQAEKMFRRQGAFHPMYHAIKRNGEQLILPALHEDKDIGVAMVKAAFMLEDVDRYVFIDEAWIVDTRESGSPSLDMEKINREGLSKHPDRHEILMYAAENRKGESRTAKRFILRPEIGKPKLAPLEFDPVFTESKGRMVGLLKW